MRGARGMDYEIETRMSDWRKKRREEETGDKLQMLPSSSDWQANHLASTSWSDAWLTVINWNVIGGGVGRCTHLIHIKAINNTFTPLLFTLITTDISNGDQKLEKEGEIIEKGWFWKGSWGRLMELGERGLICATIQGAAQGVFFFFSNSLRDFVRAKISGLTFIHRILRGNSRESSGSLTFLLHQALNRQVLLAESSWSQPQATN